MITHKTGEPQLKIDKLKKSEVRETHLIEEVSKRYISKETTYESNIFNEKFLI